MIEEIALQGVIRMDWLVIQLVDHLSHDDLLAFVKQLDFRAADYDFTKALRDYCAGAIEEEDVAEGMS